MEKKEINNNVLAVLLVFVIFISFLGTWNSLMRLQGITGAATGLGYINVSVNETTGISMVQANVNFTSTAIGISKTTYTASAITSGPFNITNDGSVLINITIADTETLFDSASLNRQLHYLYNITLADYASNSRVVGYNCSLGGSNGLAYNPAAGGWRGFPSSGTETPICRLNFTDGYDSVRIDVNITPPNDEPGGQKAARVTFTSVATTPS
ncbi:hypothetical protein HYT51_01085 [Candidatus Woesearchaeota archaeon]|nr:hypothetical protein [Candidatus Woesearchaeota archaeon]